MNTISVTRRFVLLGLAGIAVVLASVSLALRSSHDLVDEARKSEVRQIVEAGASTIQAYIDRARAGSISEAEAKRLALDALKSARFEGGGFYFISTWDGVSIASVPESTIGRDRLDDLDGRGHLFYRDIVETSRRPGGGFVEYWLPFPGGSELELKVAYVVGFPEWRWTLGTDLSMTSAQASVREAGLRLALTVAPLILLFAGLVLIMTRSISMLLRAVATSMKTVAGGDLAAAIVGLGRADEIGAMAAAVASFRDAAMAKRQRERDAEAERQSADARRRESTLMAQGAADASARVVAIIGQGLARLSAGDLTSRIDQPFAPDHETLRADFNATVDSLREALFSITEATDGIHVGSEQIAHATDDLSRRTEQQAASLEQTAAALNLVTETVRAMASGADEAARVVATARGAAETSGVIVTQAVEAMGQIKDSSSKIGNIIGVIDEIAFQTNLLALNAGVEAARAGEAGRGFAVVASEVRSLARRSAEAAREIKTLITASTVQVESGADLVGKTGAALRDIIDKVAAMDTLVRQISRSSREQATGLAEINTAVREMDQVVRENAAMVEDSTAAAFALRDESQTLTGMVERFHIGRSAPAPARGRPAPTVAVAPARAASHARPGRGPSAARPAMRVVANARPAPAARAGRGEQDWEEF